MKLNGLRAINERDMEPVIVLLLIGFFLGPFLARLYCVRDPGAEPAIVLLGAVIAWSVWVGLSSKLEEVLGYDGYMLLSGVVLIAIQGYFFWLAIAGTKCGDFVRDQVIKLLNRKK